jgi:hypothetical protein
LAVGTWQLGWQLAQSKSGLLLVLPLTFTKC